MIGRQGVEAVRPDFFIIGAFKSGTTALYEYLRPHPQIYMPFHKEPNFFGDDLTRHYGRLSLEEYLALFRDARPGAAHRRSIDLVSVLDDRRAGDRRVLANGQIIVLLRNPVDVMYAQHSQLIYRSDESLIDFATALEAEPARRRGEGLPPPPARPETLFYRHSVQFADQLARYFDVFGRERVHVILFDDLVADTAATYGAVLDFLGVDPTFRPDFTVHNENRRVRSGAMQRLVYNPPAPVQGIIRRLRRYPVVHRLRDRVLRLNSRAAKRPPMDPALRGQLIGEFEPEIDRLAQLIGRDLSAWRA